MYDTPVAEVKKGRKRTRVYLPLQMARILRDLTTPETRVAVVCLEQIHAMPGQGVHSMFKMGQGLGLWEGVIAALGYRMVQATPQAWKKALLAKGTGGDKGASLARAQALIPTAAEFLTRKKDDGRAEAILIAEHVRRLYSR